MVKANGVKKPASAEEEILNKGYVKSANPQSDSVGTLVDYGSTY